MKKKTSAILALVIMLSTIFNTNVFAAGWPSLSSSKYCEFTAAQQINVYKDTACKTRGTNKPSKAYNAFVSKNDVCYIYKITSSYAQINYPTSSGRKTGYVKTSDLLGKNQNPSKNYTATGKITTYKYKNGSTSGYIERGDNVYEISGGSYNAMYTAKSGKRAYKLAYKGAAENNASAKSSSDWAYPMNDAYVCGNDWHTYYSKRPSRPYHVGLDLAAKKGDGNVYAAANGIVCKTGFNGVNGNFIIIKHSLSGKTVYSFYAHLSKISTSANTTVKKGQKIGIYGKTGSGAAGVHLHFAITDKLSNDGSYYGYATNFNGNKTTYPNKGTTYYNPHYVIKYNKLP